MLVLSLIQLKTDHLHQYYKVSKKKNLLSCKFTLSTVRKTNSPFLLLSPHKSWNKVDKSGKAELWSVEIGGIDVVYFPL